MGITLLDDDGSNDDLKRGASNRMPPYLRHARPDLRTIDDDILSHPHRDDVELLPDIFDAYQIRNVWDSGRSNPTCGYRAFLERTAAEPGAYTMTLFLMPALTKRPLTSRHAMDQQSPRRFLKFLVRRGLDSGLMAVSVGPRQSGLVVVRD